MTDGVGALLLPDFIQDTFDPKQFPMMRHLSFQEKALEYFGVFNVLRKGLMDIFFGPKATPPKPKEDINKFIHSGSEDSKFHMTFS